MVIALSCFISLVATWWINQARFFVTATHLFASLASIGTAGPSRIVETLEIVRYDLDSSAWGFPLPPNLSMRVPASVSITLFGVFPKEHGLGVRTSLRSGKRDHQDFTFISPLPSRSLDKRQAFLWVSFLGFGLFLHRFFRTQPLLYRSEAAGSVSHHTKELPTPTSFQIRKSSIPYSTQYNKGTKP